MSQDEAKIAAGQRALREFVKEGMVLGLGSGTTSHHFVRSLAPKVAEGLSVTCTTTSTSTTRLAEDLGIVIHDINDFDRIDLTVDGPDEIDGAFQMIKGGGACLLWEKVVAHASDRMITICDETKLVDQLGRFPLPVEVVRFGWCRTADRMREVFASAGQRTDGLVRREREGEPVVTDNGNFIIDCALDAIADPPGLETALNSIPGVAENGLFTREADGMVIGFFDGASELRWRNTK